ncbi:MAG: hypothetical protein AAFQ63_17105 [Cyanobacteria bacterium J06621_11]
MKQTIFYSGIFIACIVLFLCSNNVNLDGLAVGVASAIIFLLVQTISNNLEHLSYLWYSVRYWNSNIRLSVSYLFRIKVAGKHFLIKGKRFDQFQPVGGVFKRYPSSEVFFKSINALDDNLIPIDEKSDGDLRIRVKGSDLISFLKWFNSMDGREISGWREFYEELISTNLFPESIFPYISYQYVRRYSHPIRYSSYAQSKELLIAEIYELLLTPQQEEFLLNLVNSKSQEYIWADSDQIRRRGTVPGQQCQSVNISEHSSWIL